MAKTTEIEMGGKKQTAQIFASMWEYIQHYGATVEDYELIPHEFEGEKIVGSFKPVDDVLFVTNSSDMVEIDGEYYQHVNWGEDDYCMIPEGEVDVEFWTVYRWNEKLGGYQAIGEIYRTEEEAQKEMA